MNRSFDVYGVGMEISGLDDLVGRIAEDFSYFVVKGTIGAPRLRVVVTTGGMSVPILAPAFNTRMCRASGWLKERVCDYGDGTFVISRNEGGRRSLLVSVGDEDLAYEALYSAVLSALGEELDLRGFHRVHALGLEVFGKRALVLLPSGGGKSAIAALLHRDPEVRIFSDESPLLRGDRIFPFPVRGALRPEVAQALGVTGGRVFRRKLFPAKVLISFDPQRVAEIARLDWVFVGLVGYESFVRRSVFARYAAFFVLLDSCVVGRGLAQMSEYMIRADSLWRIPVIAVRRFFTALLCISRTRCAWIGVSSDARQNAAKLKVFLSQ